MSESIPEYISKHPLHWRISDQLAIGYTDDRTIIHGPELLRDMLFVPLDRQAKAEQIEESIAQVLLAHGLHPGVNNEDAELLGELKDAFWLLFGLENPGDNKNG